MICFIALFIFAILGLFSVKYRNYFFEALDCVLRKATLRKCTTSFDKKMKMKVSSRLSKLNKSLGSFVFKYFDVLSWILTISMILSLIWTAYVAFMGLYNYFTYGNCDGPNSSAVCVYNAVAKATPDLFCFLSDNAIILVPGVISVLIVIWFLFLKKQKN
ncbi:MAG TPA: hypothetical protein PKK60_02095 [archaeon]|nr:hypothetical protein [archaeon]